MNYFDNYFKNIYELSLTLNNSDIEECVKLINEASKLNGKLIIVGNGGSAAIASHVAVDFTKAASIRAINFNEADLITCFANDYGYEYWVENALKFYADKNDTVILISSSGSSKNIINGAKFCNLSKIKCITLSGFSEDNELKKYGNINLWVKSNNYNYVEITHQTWLLSILDYIISNQNK